MYFRCKMNHPPIEVNTPARDFYCELCHKIYTKEDFERTKTPEGPPVIPAKSRKR